MKDHRPINITIWKKLQESLQMIELLYFSTMDIFNLMKVTVI